MRNESLFCSRLLARVLFQQLPFRLVYVPRDVREIAVARSSLMKSVSRPVGTPSTMLCLLSSRFTGWRPAKQEQQYSVLVANRASW